MAPSQPTRLVLRLRETLRRRVHDFDEEERHLMDDEPPVPQSPDYPLLLSLLEGDDSSTPGSDGVPPRQRYVRMAQRLRSSLQPGTRSWLNPADIRIADKHPAAAGGFADVLEGVLDDRGIMVKSYRCYELFDHVHVISVCCRRCSY